MTARRWLVALRDVLRSGAGNLVFRWRGVEPDWGVRGLRGLFTAHPDLPRRISRVATLAHRPGRSEAPIGTAHAIRGIDDDATRSAIVGALRADGCYVFPERLDPELVDALLAAGRALPRRASVDGDHEGPHFDPEHLASSRYLCRQDDLVNTATVQSPLTDPSLAALADAYLGCETVQCDVGLWQSVVFDGGSRDAASQRFHSDRDHLQFVKFFVYLTDVDSGTGPHVFVRGSHRTRPIALRRDIRYSDEEVAAWYPPDAVVELVGASGTLIAVDTSGLHKGKAPIDGERWIFELEYSSSLYGPGGLPMRVDRATDDFVACVTSQPRRYARFTLATSGDGDGAPIA